MVEASGGVPRRLLAVVAVCAVVMLSAVVLAMVTTSPTGDVRAQDQQAYDTAAADAALPLLDTDSDGTPDVEENLARSTDLELADTDDDGMPDTWEIYFGLDPNDPDDAHTDLDRDGLTNLDEYEESVRFLRLRGFAEPIDPAKGLHPLRADSDGDLLPDGWEVRYGLDPLRASAADADPDGDGLTNCQEYFGVFSSRCGGEEGGLGDDGGLADCDPLNADSDGDGLSDRRELEIYGTRCDDPDTDGDGMGDAWEVRYVLDPNNANDRFDDPDSDGLVNLDEHDRGTDPTATDSDGDGMPDGWEVKYGLDPADFSDGQADPDGDGLVNLLEYRMGLPPEQGGSLYQQSTDPLDPDADQDGLLDGAEFAHGTNPFMSDTDMDGLTDGEEINVYGTDPRTRDTDGDGLTDGFEIETSKTDPRVLDTDGDGIADGDEYRFWLERREQAEEDLEARGYVPAWILLGFPALEKQALLDLMSPFGDPDKDGLINILDADADGDGLFDGEETRLGTDRLCSTWDPDEDLYATDPVNPDSDSDRMPDGWEHKHNLDPCDPSDADGDPDEDGFWLIDHESKNITAVVSPKARPAPTGFTENATYLPFTNYHEYLNNTSPVAADTDCDLMPDGWEAYFSRMQPDNLRSPDPATPDAMRDLDADGYDVDGDGFIRAAENFTSLEEWFFYTDPNNNNTDNAGTERSLTGTDGKKTFVTAVLDGPEVYFEQRDRPEDYPDAHVGLPNNGAGLVSSLVRSPELHGCAPDYASYVAAGAPPGGAAPPSQGPPAGSGPAGAVFAVALALAAALVASRPAPQPRLGASPGA